MLEDANLVATSWRGRGKLHYRNLVPLYEIYERLDREVRALAPARPGELNRRLG